MCLFLQGNPASFGASEHPNVNPKEKAGERLGLFPCVAPSRIPLYLLTSHEMVSAKTSKLPAHWDGFHVARLLFGVSVARFFFLVRPIYIYIYMYGCGGQNRFGIPFWLVGGFSPFLEPISVVGLGCSLGVRFGF